MLIIAKTFQGLEQVLSDEIEAIGGTDTKILKRGVQFNGDWRTVYRANYELRTALRILLPVKSFSCSSDKILYQRIQEFDWSTLIGPDNTLAVEAVTFSETLNHSRYLALKTKDAVVDQLRDKYGARPNVSVTEPDLSINVHINAENVCTLSLDSSGESLHRRGYRSGNPIAPLSEVLAAGMIILSGWDKKLAFIDPMCGSGTLVIEAAMMSQNIAPQKKRNYFSFKKWRVFDKALWEDVVRTADSKIVKDKTTLIVGSDIDAKVIRLAEENIRSAGLYDVIRLSHTGFGDFKPTVEAGMIVTNPPYDERMKVDDIQALYANIGDSLKKNFQGFSAWIITSNPEAIKSVGLKPSKKIPLFNGPLECRFVRYDIFAGKRNDFIRKNV